MEKILIITLWDYKRDSGQRVRPFVEYFKTRFSEITVYYKKRNTMGSFLTLLRDSFVVGGSIVRNKNVRVIEVNPVLNYCSGLGVEFLGSPGFDKKQKSFLSKCLSLCGSVKDFAVTFSMVIYFLLKVRDRFDVCVCFGVWESAIGYLLKKTKRVRFLVYDDRDYEPGFQIVKFRQTYTAWIERYLMKRADMVTTVGSMLAELRRLQTNREIIVINNGVNYKLFKDAQTKEDHPPTIGYMGEINYVSGLDIMIKATEIIKKEIPLIRFYIVGRGSLPYEEELKRLVSDLEIAENVIFTGVVPHQELPQHLKKFDIGLACFRPVDWRMYAFPLKVIEYMAAGLPVIGTTGTETERIIQKYDCGEVTSLNEEKLARCIISLLKDTDRYRNLSFNAKKWSENFDWDLIMERNYNYIVNNYNRYTS